MAFSTQKVFIEVSFFISFIDRVNIDHLKTSQILESLAKQNFQIFTSSLVVVQTFNRLEKELGVTVADEFLQAMLESRIQILYPEQTDFLTAFRVLKNSSNRNATLSEIVDASLMDKHRVYNVLTYDSWHNLQKTQLSTLLT